MKIIGLITLAISVLLIWPQPAQANTLPQSEWYAVTWVQATDTLHWVNANGEQASIPRPTLDGEISLAQTRLHISPNGQTLAMITPLNNGREALAFYDFASGEFIQTHESEANEVFLPAGRYPFTETSSHFAVPLRHQTTGNWRLIVFEVATGNAVEQLTDTSPKINPIYANNADWWPRVANTNLDEAIVTVQVRFQMVTHAIDLQPTVNAMVWNLPPGDNPSFVTDDDLFHVDMDIHPMTGEVLFAWVDDELGDATNTINDYQGVTIASEPGGKLEMPRWLNDGDWTAYRRTNNVFQTHWVITDGQTSVPVSPTVISLYPTRDGFLIQDTANNDLTHVTNLNFEGFAEPPGTIIFAPGQSFAVIYSTPHSTPFTLQSVGGAPSVVDNNQNVAAPDTCGSAPQPRLVVGERGQMTFTDGSLTRVRTAPAGDVITSEPEGTQFDVLGGPECLDNFYWWNIRLDNGTIGWSAEGDSNNYYLEPLLGVIQPATAQPTTPPIAAELVCGNAPPTQVAVGMTVTVQIGGTLAVRTNITDPVPSQQLQNGTVVTIIGGPQCSNDLRMWQVTAGNITGWVADGFGQNYYLVP